MSRNRQALAAGGLRERGLGRGSGRGFTIAELLVVVGILLVLVGILVTVISRSQRAAMNARAKADLAVIGQALDQYALDFKGMYPMSRYANGQPVAGEHLLAKALIGPGPKSGMGPPVPPRPRIEDGAGDYDDPVDVDAPAPQPRIPKNLGDAKYRKYLETVASQNQGFRNITGGAPHLPYLDAGKFKVKLLNTGLEWQWEILDVWGTPIAYLPRRNSSKLAGPLYFGSNWRGMFDPGDILDLKDGEVVNLDWLGKIDGRLIDGVPRIDAVTKCIAIVLGDDDQNGVRGANETLRCSGPFILISAGPEKKFWGDVGNFKKNDNLYNFDR